MWSGVDGGWFCSSADNRLWLRHCLLNSTPASLLLLLLCYIEHSSAHWTLALIALAVESEKALNCKLEWKERVLHRKLFSTPLALSFHSPPLRGFLENGQLPLFANSNLLKMGRNRISPTISTALELQPPKLEKVCENMKKWESWQ